jgi:hypothetical protein
MKQFASGLQSAAFRMDIRVQSNGRAKALSQESFVRKSLSRFRPRHPVLGAAGSRVALPFAEWYFQRKQIHRSTSHFAAERRQELVARGETAYVAGISIGGFHNSGVALIEVRPEAGLQIICNNEEERFSGRKHANNYPSASLEALTDTMGSLSCSLRAQRPRGAACRS